MPTRKRGILEGARVLPSSNYGAKEKEGGHLGTTTESERGHSCPQQRAYSRWRPHRCSWKPAADRNVRAPLAVSGCTQEEGGTSTLPWNAGFIPRYPTCGAFCRINPAFPSAG